MDSRALLFRQVTCFASIFSLASADTCQVEVIKLLHDKMKELQKEFTNTPAEKYMRRPMFRITVLFVDDFVSVQRQMQVRSSARTVSPMHN